eukprot:6449361-Amphidinium_carterae.1
MCRMQSTCEQHLTTSDTPLPEVYKQYCRANLYKTSPNYPHCQDLDRNTSHITAQTTSTKFGTAPPWGEIKYTKTTSTKVNSASGQASAQVDSGPSSSGAGLAPRDLQVRIAVDPLA